MKIIDNINFLITKENEFVERAVPGEYVAFKTLDAFSNKLVSEEQLITNLPLSESNPTAGPLYVEGAMPGDVLAVNIVDIQMEKQGAACTCAGWGPLCNRMEERTAILQVEDGIVDFRGIKIPVNPMIGTIGTIPEGEGVHSGFPGRHGANMDSKMIKKGSVVYLPVFVEGAGLHIGDLHAVMGDGELCGTGLEIPGTTVVRIELIKNFRLDWPVTETDDKWYVNACAPTYEEALELACVEMQRLITRCYGLDDTDAYLYISMQCDAEINQSCKNPENCDMIVRVGVPKLKEFRPLIG